MVDSSARVLSAGRAAFLPPLKARTPAAKRAFKPCAAVAVDERPAATMAPPPPLGGMKTVTVKVRTGAEADAGISHSAYVSHSCPTVLTRVIVSDTDSETSVGSAQLMRVCLLRVLEVRC